MKVLLTVHQFLPEYSSGTEILTYKTAKELLSRGYDVSVFTGYAAQVEMEESARFDSYVYEGIKVIRFHHASIPLGGQTNIIEAEYNNLFFANYFRQYLLNWQPDIVHFFHLGRLSASAIDVCAELKIPTVMTTTDFWLLCPTNQLRLPDNSLCNGPNFKSVNCLRHIVEVSQPPEIKKKLHKLPDLLAPLFVWGVKNKILPEKWYSDYIRALTSRLSFMQNRMNKIDRVLVPTRLMQSLLQKYGLNPKRISLVPYGLDTSNIERGTDKGTMKQLRLGFIGTLYEHKGPHVLLEAICKYLPDIPINLKIYGKLTDFPDYVGKLQEIAKDDARISFCGTFPNHEIGKVFSELDVLVVPSIWYENTPLVVYSAQAAGCPVIASDVGGISEVIKHEVNGILFERGNVTELAKSIRRLYEDRKLLDLLVTQSVRPTSMQEYVNQVENTYNKLIVKSGIKISEN